MIPFLSFLGVLAVLSLTYQFLPVVSELPYGMDEALSFFVATIKSLLQLLPWMQIVWNLILWAIFIKSLLFAWRWIQWFIHLFAKAGGHTPG